MSEPSEKPKRKILSGLLAGQVLGDGLYVLPGQGNSLAIETDAGVVIIDASADRFSTQRSANVGTLMSDRATCRTSEARQVPISPTHPAENAETHYLRNIP